MEGERLVRRPIEEQIPPLRRRVSTVLGAMSTGGMSLARIPEERIEQIESGGFDLIRAQAYIDRLERLGQTGDAALVRGAINDLLDRIDELEQGTHSPNQDPAA